MTIDPLAAKIPSAAAETGDAARVHQAAQQFEGLLIAQMLRSAHAGDSGWLGTGQDQAGECAMGLAEQQVADMMAAAGGLGLASLLVQGLAPKR